MKRRGRNMKGTILGNGIRDGNDRPVRPQPASAVGFGALGAISVVVVMGGKKDV